MERFPVLAWGDAVLFEKRPAECAWRVETHALGNDVLRESAIGVVEHLFCILESESVDEVEEINIQRIVEVERKIISVCSDE